MADRGRYALATKLLGSGVVAQGCGFVATAYAATRTSPEEFALFAAVMAASAVLGSVNTLAAESRVPVVSRPAAEALNRAGFAAAAMFAVVVALAGVVGLARTETWGQVAALSAWCSFMLGVQHLLVGIILRSERQGLLARNRLTQSISNAVLIFAFLFSSMPGFYALSFAWATSLALSNAVLLRQIPGWGVGFRPARGSDGRALIGEVRWQPLSNVLSDGVAQVPLLVLPALGAPAVSGAWALASRFLTPIINMAQITLQPIYYGRAAALMRAGDSHGFLDHQRRWSLRLALAGVPVLVGCVVCLEWFIPLFGSEWEVASLALVPACLVFPMALSWLPISQTLVLSGHIRTQFVWTVVQFVLSAAAFALVPLGIIPAERGLLAWAVVSAGSMLVHRFLQRRPPVPHAPTPPTVAATAPDVGE